MSNVVPFPVVDRLLQVAVAASRLPDPLGGLRRTVGRALHAAWGAHIGAEVDLQPLEALNAAVRDPAWDDIDAAAILERVRSAEDWIADALRDAEVASTADGECGSATGLAADRCVELRLAFRILEDTAGWLERRSGAGEPPRDLRAAAWGLADLEWPEG